MTNTKISKLLKKYQIYISDLKWHIKTNIFDFEYFRNCRFRIKCYEEIVRELKAIEQYDSQQPDSREGEDGSTEIFFSVGDNSMTVTCFDEDEDMSVIIRHNGKKTFYSMDEWEAKELVKFISGHIKNLQL